MESMRIFTLAMQREHLFSGEDGQIQRMRVHKRMGQISVLLKDLESAKSHLLEALKVSVPPPRDAEDPKLFLEILSILSEVLHDLCEYSLAERYLLETFAMFKMHPILQAGEIYGDTCLTYGRVLSELGQLEGAIKYAEIAARKFTALEGPLQ